MVRVSRLAVTLVAAHIACTACKHAPAKRDAPAAVVVAVVEYGLSAEQAETDLVNPIEEAVAGMPNLAHLHAHAFAGGATVTVEPKPDQDIHAIAMAVNQQVSTILRDLPAGVSPPTISIASARMPVLRYTLRSSSAPAAELRRWQDQVGRTAMERLVGVGEIHTCGGALPEIGVAIDLVRLRARGKSITDVLAAVREHAATVESLHEDPLIRDVAMVSTPLPSPCLAFDRGVAVVSVAVYAQRGADGASVRSTATTKLAELARALPNGWTLTIVPANAIELAADSSPAPAFARAIRSLDPLPELDGYVAESRDEVAGDRSMRIVIVPHEGAADRPEQAAAAALAKQGIAVRGDRDVMIRFVGNDLAALQAAGEAVVKLPHMQPTASFGLPVAETQVILDRDRAAELGMPIADIAATLRVLGEDGERVYAMHVPGGTLDHTTITVRETLDGPPVVVSVPGKLVDNLALATVTAHLGQPIPLADVVRVQDGTAADIYHADRRRWVGVRVAAPHDEAKQATESVANPAIEIRVEAAE